MTLEILATREPSRQGLLSQMPEQQETHSGRDIANVGTTDKIALL
jgi:hypothetical protein